MKNKTSIPLIDYINDRFDGNRSAFARHENVTRQRVNEWLKGDYIVVDNKLYSLRRNLNT